MSNRTIAKFVGLVILFAAAPAYLTSCSHANPNGRYSVNSTEVSPDYHKPVTIGRIESNEVTESSGLAASLCQTDVFWTHNDSGDDAFIFAVSPAGKHLGTWRVAGARNADWEDIGAFKDAGGNCFLYIGDIGNNKGEKSELRVYRIKEPTVSNATAASTKKNPQQTDVAEATVFRYPGTAHDSEAMIVRPGTGTVYVLTKRIDGPSLVFRVVPQFGSATPVEAEKVGEVSLPAVPNGLLTGGSISPDGSRVVVCDYSAGYELAVGNAANFDEVWKQKPIPIDLGDRKQGESIAFGADGRAIYTTSEKRNSPIIEVRLK